MMAHWTLTLFHEGKLIRSFNQPVSSDTKDAVFVEGTPSQKSSWHFSRLSDETQVKNEWICQFLFVGGALQVETDLDDTFVRAPSPCAGLNARVQLPYSLNEKHFFVLLRSGDTLEFDNQNMSVKIDFHSTASDPNVEVESSGPGPIVLRIKEEPDSDSDAETDDECDPDPPPERPRRGTEVEESQHLFSTSREHQSPTPRPPTRDSQIVKETPNRPNWRRLQPQTDSFVPESVDAPESSGLPHPSFIPPHHGLTSDPLAENEGPSFYGLPDVASEELPNTCRDSYPTFGLQSDAAYHGRSSLISGGGRNSTDDIDKVLHNLNDSNPPSQIDAPEAVSRSEKAPVSRPKHELRNARVNFEDTMELLPDELVETPAEEPTAAPMEESKEYAAEEPTETHLEKLSETNMDQLNQEPVEESTESPAEESVEAPAEESVHASAKDPSLDILQSKESVEEKSTEEPTDVHREELTEEPAEDHAEQPAQTSASASDVNAAVEEDDEGDTITVATRSTPSSSGNRKHPSVTPVARSTGKRKRVQESAVSNKSAKRSRIVADNVSMHEDDSAVTPSSTASRRASIRRRSTPNETALATPSHKGPHYSGPSPQILFSNSKVLEAKRLVNFLKKQNASTTEVTTTTGSNFLCVGPTGGLKTTAKLLHSLTQGKTIVTDDWVTKSSKAGFLLDPSNFVPEALKDTINLDRSQIFSGQKIYVTPALRSDYGRGWDDIQKIVHQAGGSNLLTGSLKKMKDPESITLYIGIEQKDPVAAELQNSGHDVYKKDIIGSSVIQGSLLTDDDELLLSHIRATPPQKARATRGRGKK